MRRINAAVSLAVLVLLVIHLVWGGMVLLGMVSGGSPIFSFLSYLLVMLLCVHILIGIWLTAKTIRAARKSGTFYWRENRLFLLRRISGFALLLFAGVHILIFEGSTKGGRYFLNLFDFPALLSQLLLVVSLLLHLLTNIRPLRLALGFDDAKNHRLDVALVASVLLFLAGVAFVIYYLRWQAP